jgi:hypothetical protein
MPWPERIVIGGLHVLILMLGRIALVLLHPLQADVLHGQLPQQRCTPLAYAEGGGLEITAQKARYVGVDVVHFVLAGIRLLCAVRVGAASPA